ncbi:Lrp/AsnC family transcriptional regulator [Nocardia sp. NPDC005825]|uniref:Lrp/AsnC family transcriptional regulator n=1 Tax=unclassified Nocardia TaxID=2637762 RepID=UPI0033D11C12
MGAISADVPQTRTRPDPLPESRFTEADLALIEALQAAPRASWSQIGHALRLDATTVARRWERLRAAGLAWTTAYYSARTMSVAFVEVRCRPQALEAVSATAAGLPWVFTVDETAGDFDLLLSVASTDLTTLGRWIRRDIGGIDGVRSACTRIGITLYSEGSDWRLRALEPARLAELSGPRPPRRHAYGTRRHELPSAQDQAMLAALGADGRVGYTALGAAAGISEHTARRRLHRMVHDGDITLRCDLAYPLAGLPTMIIYRMTVPHAELEHTGRNLARMNNIRLCASVSGPHNLMVQVLLHGLHGVDEFEGGLVRDFPSLRVEDRTVTLRAVKRLGWLLDDSGRAIRHVPLEPPQTW